MRTSLPTQPVRQIMAIGLGVFAVALVFGLLIYGGSGNPAGASNTDPLADSGPPAFNFGTPTYTPTPTPDPNATATPTPTPTATPTPTPTPTPVHALPASCPDDPVKVVSSGHYALFEMYWDDKAKNLTTNPCPPGIVHEEHTVDGVKKWTAERFPPTFEISDPEHPVISILHVPQTEKESLASSVARYFKRVQGQEQEVDSDGNPYNNSDNKRPEDDLDRYPFAYPDLDDPSSESTANNVTTKTYNRESAFGDHLWVLPYCEPEVGYVETDGDLCLGFSAGLLNAEDWRNDLEATTQANGPVQFQFESIREPGLAPADRGEIFVYYPKGDNPAGQKQITWRTDDLNANVLSLDPGTYEHRHWAFSEAGKYRLQVQAEGHPSTLPGSHLKNLDDDRKTVTSVVRYYNFHVGLMADLEVAVTADDAAPAPGDTVTLTVTATNAGPDKATGTKVDVQLPVGLTFVSATPAEGDGTYDEDDAIWTIGTMAKPGTTTDENGNTVPDNATATLTVKATVDTGTRGQELETIAVIHATETIGTSHILELDPKPKNNTGKVSITPVKATNTAPMFHIVRIVPDHAAAGTKVGAVVHVVEPNLGDTLTYTLTGTDASKFTVSGVPTSSYPSGGAQIKVGANAGIDRDTAWHHDVVVNVSDGKDEDGNADSSIDASVGVRIYVPADVTPMTVSLSVDKTTHYWDDTATFTATVHNAPAGKKLWYRFASINTASPYDPANEEQSSNIYYMDNDAVGTRMTTVTVFYLVNGEMTGETTSNTVTVNWTASQ